MKERYRKVQFLTGPARKDFYLLAAKSLEVERSIQFRCARCHGLVRETVRAAKKLERFNTEGYAFEGAVSTPVRLVFRRAAPKSST